MRRTILIIIITLALCAVSCVTVGSNGIFKKSISGSGNLITKTVTISKFNKVDASRAVKVVLTAGDSRDVKIEADDNVMEHVVVKVEQGELKVSINDKIDMEGNFHVTVTVPTDGAISELEASSASKIESQIPITASEVSVDVSSAAYINATINTDYCTIDASSASSMDLTVATKTCKIEGSSASTIRLTGSATRCDADMGSAASLKANNFVAAIYNINTSSASNADINCQKSINASASSGSSIDYTGDCAGNISTSSGGSINKN